MKEGKFKAEERGEGCDGRGIVAKISLDYIYRPQNHLNSRGPIFDALPFLKFERTIMNIIYIDCIAYFVQSSSPIKYFRI